MLPPYSFRGNALLEALLLEHSLAKRQSQFCREPMRFLARFSYTHLRSHQGLIRGFSFCVGGIRSCNAVSAYLFSRSYFLCSPPHAKNWAAGKEPHRKQFRRVPRLFS